MVTKIILKEYLMFGQLFEAYGGGVPVKDLLECRSDRVAEYDSIGQGWSA